MENLSPMCETLPRRPQSSFLPLFAAVPCDGDCTTEPGDSLRDLIVCLDAHQDKLYHLGLAGGVYRNTLAKANENRDWRLNALSEIRRIYAVFSDPSLALR